MKSPRFILFIGNVVTFSPFYDVASLYMYKNNGFKLGQNPSVHQSGYQIGAKCGGILFQIPQSTTFTNQTVFRSKNDILASVL